MFWKIKAYYLLYFIPIPIFFSAAGIYRGNSLDDNTFALPISLVVFIVVYLFDIKYISVMFEKKTFLLFIMLLYSISIFLLKIIFSGSELNPNLLFISTIPLLVSFCIGYKLKPFLLRDNLTKIVDRVVFIFSFLSFLMVLLEPLLIEEKIVYGGYFRYIKNLYIILRWYRVFLSCHCSQH